jgi:C-terminal processing protease CtpA/Prc
MKLATLKHSRADVQLCLMRVWSPKGRLIEGHGTRPDVPVEWTRDDVLKGRDADLEAALNDLRR